MTGARSWDASPAHQRLQQVLLPLEIARSAGFDSGVHQAFSSRHAVEEELLGECGSQVSKVAVSTMHSLEGYSGATLCTLS